MPNESTKWLYEQLNRRGYNVGKDQAEFDSLMASNAESRAWAFETARKSGLNVGKDMEEFTSLVAPTPQATPAAPATTPMPTPTTQTPTQSAPATAPQQPAWQPTEQEKIRMSYQIHTMLNDFNQKSKARIAQVQRMTEPFTLEGRKKRAARKFQAQLAGTKTTAGFGLQAPSSPTYDGGSPQPYGVKYVDGKPVTEWVMPDGSLTTNQLAADFAEETARRNRLQHQFENRMKQNGLNPANADDVRRQAQLDYEAPMRKVLESVWAQAEAEDKAADEEYARQVEEYNKTLKSDIRAFGPDGMPLPQPEETLRDYDRHIKRKETFDLERMAQTIYANLPDSYRQQQLEAYTAYFNEHPGELKGKSVQQAATEALQGEIYNAVYQRAVAARMPKSKTEFFFRKLADQPFISQDWWWDKIAAQRTGSWGMNVADMDAMSQYGAQHRALDITGTIVNMAIDPTTYISGGVGSAAGKQALKVGCI